MSRLPFFVDFRPEWILHEDADLVFVDKPAGVPSQEAVEGAADDVRARLAAFLAARGDASTYLGVHQRLDRDTSGVLVFTRRREANANVAAQLEGRRVRKRYLACVTGWTRKARLEHWLVKEKGRSVVVDPHRRRGADRAVMTARLVEARGDRQLLELVLETGRMHQARVQLAEVGSPIAGDRLYGDGRTPAASRLMLHASSLAMEHPATGKTLTITAPTPPELSAWLRAEEDRPSVDHVRRALGAAIERRFALGRREDTTAFRLVNEGGDALRGMAVDVYGRHAVVHFYGPPFEVARSREIALDEVFRLGFDGVYVKVRPKQANLLVDTRREDLAPARAVRGTDAPDPLVVLEEGIPFAARLGDGLSTGIFLDQRGNRRLVRSRAKGARVLNLFAYTCGFTVAAALGGAKATVSVDASMAALERGKENLALSGADDARRHVLVADDAFRWLAREKERFDLVILDPPSYASTKSSRFSTADDYGELAQRVLSLVAPGGRLLACTNHRKTELRRFRRVLKDAAARAKIDVSQVKDLPDPVDFPSEFGTECHLKSVLITLP